MASTLLEKLNIASGFIPVDLQAAANNGDYISLKDYERVMVVFYKAVGTAGDDPTLTLQQADTVAGGNVKDLDFTVIHTKQGADLTAVGSWTKQTQTAANTYTDATSAELAALWVVEFKADDLDVDNGFDCIRATVADVGGNAQLGCLFYLLAEPRYPAVATSMVDPLVD